MATETTHTPGGGLLQYLPAIYSEDPFLGQLLLAFEKVLLGRDDAPGNTKPGSELNPRGLEQTIDGLASLFDPAQTPEEFLPWLAKWAALGLRADMSLGQQRRFVAEVIPLYQKRGTRGNLQKLLGLYLQAEPTVEVDENVPYFFHVTIKLPPMEVHALQRQFEIAQALVELEKPAHTNYRLSLDTPSLQINVRSRVGVDTLLGTAEERTKADKAE